MFITEVALTEKVDTLSPAELENLEWLKAEAAGDYEGKTIGKYHDDGYPSGYPEGFAAMSRSEQAEALDHEGIRAELDKTCQAAVDSLPGSVVAEGKALKPTEYRLLVALTFGRRAYVLDRLDRELIGDPESVPVSPMLAHDLHIFPLSVERIRRDISPTLEAREGTKAVDLDSRAITKAAKSLQARGLITVKTPGKDSRAAYRWAIEIIALKKLSALHSESRKDLTSLDISQVALLLTEWRIKTTQAAVLVPVRVEALRQSLKGVNVIAVEYTNAELEALVGANRQTAQKVLSDAPFAEGLAVTGHQEVGSDSNRAVFRTEMSRVDINQGTIRPAPPITISSHFRA